MRKPGAAQRGIMFRCLRTLFEAGVPMHRACHILAKQLPHPGQAAALLDVTQRMERGTSMADALTYHPGHFSRVDVNLIRVGTRTGSLGDALDQLASFHESSARLAGRASSALIYPLFTLAACLLMVVLGPPLLFRSLFDMIRTSGVPLPWISKLLIGLSDLLRNPLFWIVLVVAGVTTSWLVGRIERKRRLYALDWLAHHSYLTRRVTRIQAVARFARALAVTTRCGVPIQEAVRLSAASCGSLYLEQHCRSVSSAIVNGDALSTSLERSGYFPRLFLMTLVSGEESGHFSESLLRLAEMYELELECQIDALADSLGPIVTALVGGVAGVVNIATILPLMRLIEKL